MALFEARTLVAGFLGRLHDGEVEWNEIFNETHYSYSDLYD